MLGPDESGERVARVDAGGNYVRIDFISVGQHHALSLAALHDNLGDAGLRANLDPGLAGRVCNRI